MEGTLKKWTRAMIGLRASLCTEKGPNFDCAKNRSTEFLIFLLRQCFSQILPLDRAKVPTRFISYAIYLQCRRCLNQSPEVILFTLQEPLTNQSSSIAIES